MGEPDDPSLFRSVKSKAKAFGLRREKDTQPVLPTHTPTTLNSTSLSGVAAGDTCTEKSPNGTHTKDTRDRNAKRNNVADTTANSPPPPAPPPPPMPTRMKNGTIRFLKHTKDALTYNWINLLLIFVPIGIASKPAKLAPEIIFSMNAIAIIPLAGLLAHATEAVAVRVGDTLGALLNVSFGNAVELILFIILLAGNQIRVVQAALLGSILANLLLILGMAFLFGGLRYQEQIYNNTVTQMSACMLSLAVMSLLLPTAFHSAFSNYARADKQTLHVSRGTSVILLLVYILYLIFQLKSHSYMYASTPQHIIDEESHPGVLAGVLDSSSSSSSSSDSSSTDSDSTAGSHTTAKRIKRAFRTRRRRKSNASSKESPSVPSVMNSPSVENHKSYFEHQRNRSNEHDVAVSSTPLSRRGSFLNAVMSGDEADTDEHVHQPVVRDFEVASSGSLPTTKKEKKTKHKSRHHHRHSHHRHHERRASKEENEKDEIEQSTTNETTLKVAFADDVEQITTATTARRPFVIRPALPSLLSSNVFNNPQNPPPPANVDEAPLMSRTAAVMMLLISTGLVAICADFMSDAIEPMVEKTGISQAFIGLIILPIVGNAAEHVTAVLVATKNKMDLAIGVAVGSSIQIAIFITPVIVLLGWCMGKEMSLYFNIFETVALFATVFVVNFLVLDGRSNYLEGSLLIAAYVIIALASFFYPDGCDASQIGGQEGICP
ncbi:calcium/proton exchanger [Amniculicola lignicola CBS 123094]|uniref:Calcium/proton exchanger n=1 Tax=Amniculicola lignicola CBS 123094 TaxID=1392246 RepID=A0A6A5WIR8_9PLEO|nr:calcium/proton exchanger [Amniculicola lignicola CBS 123094]